MVVVAQLVRAPDCDSGGRRFESGLSPHPEKSRAPAVSAFFVPGNGRRGLEPAKPRSVSGANRARRRSEGVAPRRPRRSQGAGGGVLHKKLSTLINFCAGFSCVFKWILPKGRECCVPRYVGVRFPRASVAGWASRCFFKWRSMLQMWLVSHRSMVRISSSASWRW